METAAKKPTVPALYEHCTEVYEAMAERAVIGFAYPDDEEETLVYEGFLTRLIKDDLHYSVPYYTSIRQKLMAMDCIRQIRRGGSTTPSRWLMVLPPTLELFENTASSTVDRTKKATRMDSLEQQVRDMNERLTRAGY